MPDNTLMLSELLHARLLASDRYSELGEMELKERYLQNAATLVPQLQERTESFDALWAITIYWGQIGEQDKVLVQFERDKEQQGRINNYLAIICTSIHFGRGEYQRALEAFDKTQPSFQRVGPFARTYTQLALTRSAVERDRIARKYLGELDRRLPTSSGLYRNFDWTVLRLVGENERAADLGVGYRKSLELTPGITKDYVAIADFMHGNLTADELLGLCSWRPAIAEANYVIAFDYLTKGDRASAKEHFQAVLETNYRWLYVFGWSKAFLERIEDPEWLPWLPNIAIGRTQAALSVQ